jgi:hypothetical protein
MWSVNSNVGCTAATTSVELRRSTNGLAWSPPQQVMLSLPGMFVWHIDVQWIPSLGQYWALFNAKVAGNCSTPALYLATSADGVTWHPVWSIVSQAEGVWTTYAIDLVAQAASHGITLNDTFRIKFQQFDNSPVNSDGMGFDEISVSLPADDWYRFQLEAGQSVSVGASVAGTATFSLYDPAGQLVATAAPFPNLNLAVRNFVATTSVAVFSAAPPPSTARGISIIARFSR